MNEGLWAVQYLNDDGNWVVCQTILLDYVGLEGQGSNKVACVFFHEQDAAHECEVWKGDTGEPDRYRFAKVSIIVDQQGEQQ
jgi:hypothetical protein